MMSEQTYRDPQALAWMDAGLCPECGGLPESHGSDNRFWAPINQGCSLMERGVRDRIAWQKTLTE